MVVTAEAVYAKLLDAAPEGIGPGWRGELAYRLDDGSAGPWPFMAELRENAVWRLGRVFLQCPACGRRTTRLYVPVAGLALRCRPCWGLSYESQSWSYRPVAEVGPWGCLSRYTTQLRRHERQRAARARYTARRVPPPAP